MPEVWVVNASPIIVLAKAGRLHLLNDLADELVVPEPVAQELLRGPPSDPARQAIEAGWAPGQTPLTIPANLLEWGLGAGETAVLALALERSPSTAILDDAAARNCAKAANIPVLGTLGAVLRAKNAASFQGQPTRYARSLRLASSWTSEWPSGESVRRGEGTIIRPSPDNSFSVLSPSMATLHPALLQSIAIFQNLSASDAEELLNVCEEVQASAGQVVFDAGVANRALYVVLEGTVEIDLEPARAAERVVAVLEAGSVFGESSFFHAQPHSGTVKARTAGRLLRLNREAFDRLLASGSPAALRVAANAADVLAARLQQADALIVTLLEQIQDEKVHTAIRDFRRSLFHSSSPVVPPGMPGGS